MSDAVFGQVEFFTHVQFVRGDTIPMEKKVKLHVVHCEYQDRFETVSKGRSHGSPHVVTKHEAGKDILNVRAWHIASGAHVVRYACAVFPFFIRVLSL